MGISILSSIWLSARLFASNRLKWRRKRQLATTRVTNTTALRTMARMSGDALAVALESLVDGTPGGGGGATAIVVVLLYSTATVTAADTLTPRALERASGGKAVKLPTRKAMLLYAACAPASVCVFGITSVATTRILAAVTAR